MTTVRGVKDRRFKFVQLLNSMFEDSNLSLKAKGLIGYCLTKTENWNFHIDHLSSVLKEGVKSIYSVINECIERGYAYRYQGRSKDGKLLPMEFIISDSKEEIETLRKDLESDPSFKKCLPDRRFGDAVSPLAGFGDAVFPGEIPGCIYSNTDSSNTEKQQQAAAVFSNESHEKEHPKPPEIPDTPLPTNNAPFYGILADIDIPAADKAWVSARYPEDAVKNAIEWATSPQTKLTKGLVQAIKWACQNKPEVPKNRKDEISENKAYVARYDGRKNGYVQVWVLNESVEFSFVGSQKSPLCIKYEEKGFKEQFNNAIRKFDL